jgi:multidrug transporter EmrE-like cation transporter
LLCYALTAFLALIAFHRQQWGWIITVWSCFSFVLAMLLSVLLFREPFTVKRAIASAFVLHPAERLAIRARSDRPLIPC